MILKTEIILYVEDQNRSKEFYSKLLNMQPVLDVPGMTEFKLNENLILGLMPENSVAKILGDKNPHPATGNGIPRCELYLRTDNIEESFKTAIQKQYKCNCIATHLLELCRISMLLLIPIHGDNNGIQKI